MVGRFTARTDLQTPRTVGSFAGLRHVGERTVCHGDQVRRLQLGGGVGEQEGLGKRRSERFGDGDFADIPSRSVALLRRGDVGGAYGGQAGEVAAASSELRAAFLEFADQAGVLGTIVEAMAAEIAALRSDVQSLNIQREIADWRLASTIMNQVTACVVSVASAISSDVASVAGRSIAAGATCTNSVGQSMIAMQITDREQTQSQLAASAALSRFQREFAVHYGQIAETANAIRAASARIEGANTRIDDLRRQGRRALARALMLDSDPGDVSSDGALGRQFRVNAVTRRRHNTLRIRYEQAHRNAIRQAYIAKLALEQRLGMRLDQMTDEMTLLDEPPARWEADLCQMSAINYDRIRGSSPAMSGLEVPDNYAGEYVGDYVRKLGTLFESYSLDYPFQAGTDTTVLSLRDQLFGIRATCPTEVPNLLHEAGQLDVRAASSGALGWEQDGCVSHPTWPPETAPPGAVSYDPPPTCVVAEQLALGEGGGPLPSWHADFGAVGGYRVHFGQDMPPYWRDSGGDPVVLSGGALAEIGDGTGSTAIGNGVGTSLRQWVELAPGRYRLSFFGRQPAGLVDPADAVKVYYLAGGTTPTAVSLQANSGMPILVAPDETHGTDPEGAWNRYYSFFDLPEDTWVAVAVEAPQNAGAIVDKAVDLGGLMLEDVTGQVQGTLSATAPDSTSTIAELNSPRPFFNTDQTRLRDLPVCEDTTGDELRRRAFRRGCIGLCPDGYGDCAGALEQHCYYETSFSLTPESLQRAGLLGTSGFAFGNFNYRIDGLAANVVGTGITDCSESVAPSSCYSSGNVSYSVVHLGPYGVRNHTGGHYDAPLFTGRVERARALAAERYVTNPISSADRGLIEPYVRSELRGRPLAGTYLLRVWDDPTLAWENVEDIQILLNYRYWTRQE